MSRKEILEKRLARLEKKKNALAERALASQDVSEVRAINAEIEELGEEITEVRELISAEETGKNGEISAPVNREIVNSEIIRNSVGTFTQSTKPESRENITASVEYRTAFKAYVQRGTPIPAELHARAGGDPGATVTGDIGMIIPSTIMDEFIKEVSKVYGQVYAKVRKLNIKGGLKFPISDLKAEFKWINESTVSPTQKAGDIKDYIEFSYNIGEIRVAESLLASIVSLPLFESEIVRVMTEAYVKAMDYAILKGTGVGQPLGILNDARVTNVVELTASEFSDWAQWRKKLFAKVPLSKRGTGEFLFPASTVESYLLTIQDSNERPIFREATEITITDFNSSGRFFGREVVLVEPDMISDFDTASPGDVVGIFWIPTDYAINTQQTFGIKRYFDENTNMYINKMLTVIDGKIIDPSGCYLIKKKAG